MLKGIIYYYIINSLTICFSLDYIKKINKADDLITSYNSETKLSKENKKEIDKSIIVHLLKNQTDNN